MKTSVTESFIENTLFRIDENTRMLSLAFSKVTEAQLWESPNAVSNSLGNQILHLKGNLTQYIISGLGGQPDFRQRDLEFSTQKGLKIVPLLNDFKTTVKAVKQIIQNLNSDQLIKEHQVQGFTLTGLGLVLHAVEHYSYHTGQIAFWVKQLTAAPLGFYDGMNLNQKNIL